MSIVQVYLSHLWAVGTHLPALLLAVQAAPGPILELGCGGFSTALLHGLSNALRPVVSVESKRGWYDRLKGLASPVHRFVLLQDGNSDDFADEIGLRHWAVVFVDGSPADGRAAWIHWARDKADMVVVHDTEPESRKLYAGVEEALASYAYRIDFPHALPWTSVVSEKPIALEGCTT